MREALANPKLAKFLWSRGYCYLAEQAHKSATQQAMIVVGQLGA